MFASSDNRIIRDSEKYSTPIMSSFATKTWFWLFGPRLYNIYRYGPRDMIYKPNAYEDWGDRLMRCLIAICTSPILFAFLYIKGYFDIHQELAIFGYLSRVIFVLVILWCCKVYGRITNPQYNHFVKHMTEAYQNSPTVDVSILQQFDFDFSAWPVDYYTKHTVNYVPNCKSFGSLKQTWSNIIGSIVKPLFVKQIYPSTMGLMHWRVRHLLLEGRAQLVESYNGLRYKLKTGDNNNIECMFVDRTEQTVKGKILVITCEGYVGWYEIGVMLTPVQAGYSVLGWNLPGIGGSTGSAYPTQQHFAMDAVMQFAIRQLNFTPENIVLYGKGIGGYIATWAASQYHNIKGIFLDATCDNIFHVSGRKLPESCGLLLKSVIRNHFNLNIAEILKEFDGPVIIVRRTRDQMMTTSENGNLSTNRGNELLIKLLCHRYPSVFGSDQIELTTQYLALQGPALSMFKNSNHPGLPEVNGKVFFLLEKYLIDYQSNHYKLLPKSLFQIPTNVEF